MSALDETAVAKKCPVCGLAVKHRIIWADGEAYHPDCYPHGQPLQAYRTQTEEGE